MLSRRSLVHGLSAGTLGAVAAPTVAQSSPPSSGSSLSADSGAVILAAGRHVVSTNMTVRADVLVMPGATIDVAAGKMLTFIGDFQAPVAPVFTGAGQVDLNRSRTPVAYPEWWGARRDDGSADSLPALRACLNAHPHMALGACDYYISSTWIIDKSHRRIWGSGKNWRGPNEGTRIIVTNNIDDAILVGTDRAPPHVNSYLRSVDLRWLEATRSQAPAGRRAACGLRLSHVLDCHIEGVSATEHATAFYFRGVVHSHVRDCQAFRSAKGSGAGAGFRGFHFDGRHDIGLAGGNASLFVQDCNATIGGAPDLDDAVGALLEGGFADTFLTQFETSAIADGIRVDGMAGSVEPRLTKAGHVNLHIMLPVIDGFSGVGIAIRNVSEYGAIAIVDPYLGAARGCNAGISIVDSGGAATISGGQLLGWLDGEANGSAVGFQLRNADGLQTYGTAIVGFRHPMTVDRCRNLGIDVMINNPDQRASQAAIVLNDCSVSRITARIKGKRNIFPAGLSIGGAGSRLVVDVSGIDEEAIAGGHANILRIDGGANSPSSAKVHVVGMSGS